MIQIKNLSKSFGGQLIFKDVSFSMGKGEKLGFIGRNGSGKSTLFNLITCELPTDSGEISIPKTYRIGTLSQYINFSHPTLLEECVSALETSDEYDSYKAEKVLFGLGFSTDDLGKNPEQFSGGYQLRINLAKVLVRETDMLLLDEPSNYLDIVSLRWLKEFLRTFPGEFILITHDRDFMDSVTTHTMGISRMSLKKVSGGTEKYFDQLALEEEIYRRTMKNLGTQRKNLEQFVSRFKAKASKASQAKSKMKQLKRLPSLDKIIEERAMSFKFNYFPCHGKDFLNVKNLCFAYPGGEKIINGLDMFAGRGDRIAVIGKNGKGKSTFLNLLASKLKPIDGEIKMHHGLRFGHFGQTNVDQLDQNKNVIEEIQSANPKLPMKEIRGICGAVLFEREFAEKKIKVLSGGEKSRVLLGKLLVSPTNLLLLDEPTNHLDVESVEVLMHQLEKYPGTIIIVTHNESILRLFAQKLVVFHHEKTDFFEGNYDYFLEKIGWSGEDKSGSGNKKTPRKDIKRQRSEIIKERSKILGPMEKCINELEDKICNWEKREKEFSTKMIKASNNSDGEEINKMSMEVGILNKKIEKAFLELEKISPKYDKLKKKYENLLNKLK